MPYAIGIDVGGTHLRVALIDGGGKILNRRAEVVGEARDPAPFFARLAGSIRETAGEYLPKISGVGLGLPGICNGREKVIHQLPHFPAWRDVSVVDLLQKEFDCPIVFDNDANMAAVGEHWKGIAAHWPSFIMLTLGTGIGGGVFLNGKIWQGEEGFAGEVGHMVIDRNGPACICGQKGCWEVYAASQSVPKGTTAEKLSQEASAGDAQARLFWKNFGAALGVGILNLAHITGVEHFVIGGGIGKAFDHFIASAKNSIQKGAYPRLSEKIVVFPTALDGNAALLGCAASVLC
ncbi:MAG: ROK family protein [Deltaproteobacteria bacterium]|nr:ROK family protein [Deltaproteobacteria bacterium]